jgi:hypothetical protein
MQTFHHLKKNSSMLHTWEGLLLQQASPNFGTYRQASTLKLGEALGEQPFPVFLLLAKFRQISTWKIWFGSTQRIFSLEKITQICKIFKSKNFQLLEFYDNFQKVAKEKKFEKKIPTFESIM